MGENRIDARLDVGAADTCDAHQRRFHIAPTNADDAFGVGNRCCRFGDDMLIAGLLTGGDETRADPPHQRVEPEDRFDQHVDHRGEVVATPHVADLVRDHRGELVGGQVRIDSVRQQDHWPPESDDAWFEHGGRGANLDAGRHVCRGSERRAGANGSADLAPLPRLTQNDRRESAEPDAEEQRRDPLRLCRCRDHRRRVLPHRSKRRVEVAGCRRRHD